MKISDFWANFVDSLKDQAAFFGMELCLAGTVFIRRAFGGGGHWLVRMEWHPAGWSVSASVNLLLHHKVQKFSSGTGSPGWSQKKAVKWLWWLHFPRMKVLTPISSPLCHMSSVVSSAAVKVC